MGRFKFLSCLNPKPSDYDPEVPSTDKRKAGPSVNEKADGLAKVTNDIDQLTRDKTSLQKELDDVKRQLVAAEKSAQNEGALQKQVAELKTELASAQDQLQRAHAEIKTTSQNLQNAKAEAISWEQALQEEKQKNVQQNEERDLIMESMKSYLDTHDDVDASSLKKELANVNDLVEQLASDMIFRWDTPDQRSNLDPTGVIPQRMNGVLGSHLVQALLTCNIHDDGSPSLLQYAFHIVALSRVSELFQARTFNSEEFDLIQKLSHRIRTDEIQPVYGRWRSVTQRYLRLIDEPGREAKLIARFSRDIAADIHSVALLFGYPVTETHEDLQGELEQSLADIAKKTVKLATVVTTEVVTKDYDIYKPTSGRFDPESMEPPFKLENSPEDDSVFGTTSLGMTSIGKPGRQQVAPEQRVFQKAVVITEAALRDIMHPIPVKNGGRKDA